MWLGRSTFCIYLYSSCDMFFSSSFSNSKIWTLFLYSILCRPRRGIGGAVSRLSRPASLRQVPWKCSGTNLVQQTGLSSRDTRYVAMCFCTVKPFYLSLLFCLENQGVQIDEVIFYFVLSITVLVCISEVASFVRVWTPQVSNCTNYSIPQQRGPKMYKVQM